MTTPRRLPLTVSRLVLVAALALAIGAPIPAGFAATTIVETTALDAADRYAAMTEEIDRLESSTDPADKIKLGKRYASGIQVSATNPLMRPDPERAIAVLEGVLAGKAGNDPEAAGVLGRILLERGTDAARAMALLRDAAKAGDGAAAILLADRILAGRPHEAARDEARRLYAVGLAARQPEAAAGLARLETVPDRRRSLRGQELMLLRLRAETSGRAAFALWQAYAKGDGIPENPEEAERFLRMALDLGYSPAVEPFVALGNTADRTAPALDAVAAAIAAGSREAARVVVRSYAKGGPLPVDAETAAYTLALLNEVEDPEGLYFRALFQLTGAAPFTQDRAAAEATVERLIAAPGTAPLSLVSFGRQFRDRVDAPGSGDLALRLFLAMAERGERSGTVEAADFAFRGGYAVDEKTAARIVALLQTAAEANDGEAMLVLANLYRSGRVLPRSPGNAAALYDRAISLGVVGAYEAKARLILETACSEENVQAALSLYRSAAEAGSSTAMIAIGRIYLTGRGALPANPAEGEGWMRRAWEAGNTNALVVLADYQRGTGSDEGLARARDLYQQAWDAGDLNGAVGIGDLLVNAGKVAKAEKIWQSAVDAGNPTAMLRLADLYLDQTQNAKRLTAARKLLDRAAAAGASEPRIQLLAATTALRFPDPAARAGSIRQLERIANRGESDATGVLVDAYLSGAATGKPDKVSAIRWARSAARDGSAAPAIRVVDALLIDGASMSDARQAQQLLEEALVASPDNLKALGRLAEIHSTGKAGAVDTQSAFALYLRAAKLGGLTAQLRVAHAYLDGIGTARDAEAAHLWYTRAADAGSRDAMVDLGKMFASGAGISIDAEQSFSNFYRAAQAGSVEAMQEIGKALIAGYGTARDTEQGRKWLEKAAAQGSVGAMYDLFSFYNLQDAPDAFDQSIVWLTKAAENGSAGAMFRLAMMMRTDLRWHSGAREDALAWLKKSAASGHKGSVRLLEAIKAGREPIVPDLQSGSNETAPPQGNNG